MVMQTQPIYDCYMSIWRDGEQPACPQETAAPSPAEDGEEAPPDTPKPHLIYLSPKGRVLTQQRVVELAACDRLVLLCGHYEGVDQRVLDEICLLYTSDKSLVEGGIHRARTQQMLQFLGACCHELDMGCLLEGVETAEQAEMARRIGCDAMQGFFCAPPMPIENFPAWLARRQTDGV